MDLLISPQTSQLVNCMFKGMRFQVRRCYGDVEMWSVMCQVDGKWGSACLSSSSLGWISAAMQRVQHATTLGDVRRQLIWGSQHAK
jgi:hypothetical protein